MNKSNDVTKNKYPKMNQPKIFPKNTIRYYTPQDYNSTLNQLPELVKIAERKSLELMEPTIYEQREIMQIIKKYVSDKHRKVYGGTAVNELIKTKNAADAIYDDYKFGDIDFYSYEPVVDLVNICNILYNTNKFKQINGKEAFHEESYRIYVNMQMYCNITYVPKRVYAGIKHVTINDIDYVDPHFIWIDQLRICTNPLVDSRLWEQTFKRSYLLLKYYPLEIFDTDFNIAIPSFEMSGYFARIKKEFFEIPEIQDSTLINGFEAFNFFVRYADDGTNECNIPYLELTTINYTDTVIKMYDFLKTIVGKPELLTHTEYFPFFQFVGNSIIFSYDDTPIVVISEASSVCIPVVRLTSGVRYAAYQYLLMSLLVNKFRSFLDKEKEMYFNYGISICSLVLLRNDYLKQHKLHPINDTAFTEFRVPCMGTPVNSARLYVARKNEKREKGKRQEFTYSPEYFFKATSEIQAKFDPHKACFKNTSGNINANMKHTLFKIVDDHLIKNDIIDDSSDDCLDIGELDN